MATTRRAMHLIECSQADLDLVNSLLTSRSDAEATIALSLLVGSFEERELVMLVNLREVLRELPTVPFRAGQDLEVLERAGRYESTGRSYRRMFESSHGVFGIEFLGAEHECADIVVHAANSRYSLGGGADDVVDARLLALFVNHGVVLDAVLEALELIGWPLDPTIYVTSGDFFVEHCAATAKEAMAELF